MVSKSKVIEIVAWFLKVFLLMAGLVMLLSPDYAVYLRVIGLLCLVVATLSFKRSQNALLKERGIRIPNVVIAVLLIGTLLVAATVFPSASDLEVTDENIEMSDDTLTYTMAVENTGDGQVVDVKPSVNLNTSEKSVSKTTLEETDIGRGDSHTYSAEFSLSELDSDTRSRIENGNYEIYVVFDGGEKTHTFSP